MMSSVTVIENGMGIPFVDVSELFQRIDGVTEITRGGNPKGRFSHGEDGRSQILTFGLLRISSPFDRRWIKSAAN